MSSDEEGDGVERKEEHVELGFVEPVEGDGNTSCGGMHDDPDYRNWDGGTVGGVPSWLDPVGLPGPTTFRCDACGDQLRFLQQIYAPLDEVPDAFHRTLYLFCCRDGRCLQQGRGLLALRSQLPQRNAFYPEDPGVPAAARLPPPKAPSRRLCRVCGCPGDMCCARCRSAWYCSKAHQKCDWRHVHKTECTGDGGKGSSTVLPAPSLPLCETAAWNTGAHAVRLPEFDILIESEPEEAASAALPSSGDVAADEDKSADDAEGVSGEERLLRKKFLKEGAGAAAAKTDDISEEDAIEAMQVLRGDAMPVESDEDEDFLRFQSRIAVAKDQCLRYARWIGPSDDPTAGVLWVASTGKAKAKDIPPCPHCSGPRGFEFQVTPQMLFYLGMLDGGDHGIARGDGPSSKAGSIGAKASSSSARTGPKADLTWGTLAVFTCRNSCTAAASVDDGLGTLCREFVWRQPAAGEK